MGTAIISLVLLTLPIRLAIALLCHFAQVVQLQTILALSVPTEGEGIAIFCLFSLVRKGYMN